MYDPRQTAANNALRNKPGTFAREIHQIKGCISQSDNCALPDQFYDRIFIAAIMNAGYDCATIATGFHNLTNNKSAFMNCTHFMNLSRITAGVRLGFNALFLIIIIAKQARFSQAIFTYCEFIFATSPRRCRTVQEKIGGSLQGSDFYP
ncbi:hypothetical protein [Escherichia coli]|uniref:hypothetical protein n=1 Tax=Escherichia coli TaxID=562 RepID=UPI0032E457E5